MVTIASKQRVTIVNTAIVIVNTEVLNLSNHIWNQHEHDTLFHLPCVIMVIKCHWAKSRVITRNDTSRALLLSQQRPKQCKCIFSPVAQSNWNSRMHIWANWYWNHRYHHLVLVFLLTLDPSPQLRIQKHASALKNQTCFTTSSLRSVSLLTYAKYQHNVRWIR